MIKNNVMGIIWNTLMSNVWHIFDVEFCDLRYGVNGVKVDMTAHCKGTLGSAGTLLHKSKSRVHCKFLYQRWVMSRIYMTQEIKITWYVFAVWYLWIRMWTEWGVVGKRPTMNMGKWQYNVMLCEYHTCKYVNENEQL